MDTGPVEDNSVAFLCWYPCCNPDTLQVESMLVDSNLHAGNKVQNLLNQVLIRTGSTPCSDQNGFSSGYDPLTYTQHVERMIADSNLHSGYRL